MKNKKFQRVVALALVAAAVMQIVSLAYARPDGKK